MWTLDEMGRWDSDVLKRWYSELDESYTQLSTQGKWEASAMMTFVREIIYLREKKEKVNEKA